MGNTYYEPGTYNRECAECGQDFKRSELRLRYDGLLVCTKNDCWEEEHPRDLRNKKLPRSPKFRRD